MKYVAARYHGPTRSTSSINLIVLHSTEGPESPNSAEGTAAYFASDMGGRQASAHVVVDNDSEITCVPDNVVAYGAANANATGLHLEQAGTANQTGAQWRDPYSTAVCLRAGAQIARWCSQYPQLHPVFINSAQLKAGVRNGVTTHAEVSKAFPSTGHTDPGGGYPLAEVLQIATSVLNHPPGSPSQPPPSSTPTPVDWAALRRSLAASYSTSWKSLGNHPMDPTANKLGLDVALLQQSLNLITTANLIVDGQYGASTRQAVINFQLWINNTKPGSIPSPPDAPGAVYQYTRFFIIASLDSIAAS